MEGWRKGGREGGRMRREREREGRRDGGREGGRGRERTREREREREYRRLCISTKVPESGKECSLSRGLAKFLEKLEPSYVYYIKGLS